MTKETQIQVVDTNKITALARPSVLGTGRPSIPEGGKIRPGIMVLTRANKQNQQAMQIYNDGVASGLNFNTIQKQIKDTLKLSRNPMTPKNVPYFTVRASDFVVPNHAQQIMDQYGEDRGDGKRLYRFPAVFPLDDLDAVMPHSLRVFTHSELKYWSDYAPDGTRLCMTRADVPVNGNRAHRSFGGRKIETRCECDPDNCAEFQAKKCNLSGKWVFYVPGLVGAQGVSLSTNSFYSMEPARELLMMIMQARGRISGLQDGKPLFWFSKSQDVVSMIDPATGKAKRVKQFIIKLTADVDMMHVFESQEAAIALPAGGVAAAALGGPAINDDEPMEFDEGTGEIIDSDDDYDGEPPIDGDLVDEVEIQRSQSATVVNLVKKLRADIAQSLEIIGLTPEEFSKYAKRQWGEGWATNQVALEKALSDVLRGADQPGDYRNYVVLNADGLG